MSLDHLGFVLPDFRGGGAESVLINLANYISDNYFVRVTIIVGKKNGPNLSRISNKISILEMGTTSGIKAVPYLIKLNKEFKFDSLIGTLGMAHAVAISKLFFRNKVHCSARLGNTISKDLENWSGIKKVIHKYYQKVLGLADVIVAQSEYMKIDLQNYIKKYENIKAIYNPINLSRLYIAENSASKFNRDSFNVVSIGRLSRQKDYVSSILAAKIVKNKIPNFHLHIFGTGELNDSLQKLVRSNSLDEYVHFYGYRDDAINWLAHADVLLLTSLYEGFSNVVLEALALGIPVVATDSPGGNREIIVEEENGFFCRTGDPESISNSLVKSFNFKLKFDVNLIRHNFSMEKISKQYMEVMFEKSRI